MLLYEGQSRLKTTTEDDKEEYKKLLWVLFSSVQSLSFVEIGRFCCVVVVICEFIFLVLAAAGTAAVFLPSRCDRSQPSFSLQVQYSVL